jgi:hypothetical protein
MGLVVREAQVAAQALGDLLEFERRAPAGAAAERSGGIFVIGTYHQVAGLALRANQRPAALKIGDRSHVGACKMVDQLLLAEQDAAARRAATAEARQPMAARAKLNPVPDHRRQNANRRPALQQFRRESKVERHRVGVESRCKVLRFEQLVGEAADARTQTQLAVGRAGSFAHLDADHPRGNSRPFDDEHQVKRRDGYRALEHHAEAVDADVNGVSQAAPVPIGRAIGQHSQRHQRVANRAARRVPRETVKRHRPFRIRLPRACGITALDRAPGIMCGIGRARRVVQSFAGTCSFARGLQGNALSG